MSPPDAPDCGDHGSLRELVVCSLETWDDVWRRNQFLTDRLLRRHPSLRVLFVEPAADILFDLSRRQLPTFPRLRRTGYDGRLLALRPLKPLPRRLGSASDWAIRSQVSVVARAVRFQHPVLWINDVTYAPLAQATGWPVLYDITDDWLLGPASSRELERLRGLEKLAFDQAAEVVVCSQALAESKANGRRVHVIPNGVDVEHFRHPQPRPLDLPPAPVAVYVGTLHEARLDVALVRELAQSLPELSIVLVGPDALSRKSRSALAGEHNLHILGSRPYVGVPAYLQHADVVIVPHVITPFTESLDPIKAYESQAIGTPTVATPVAGFRDIKGITVTEAPGFVPAIREVLAAPRIAEVGSLPIRSWAVATLEFEHVLLGVVESGDSPADPLRSRRPGARWPRSQGR